MQSTQSVQSKVHTVTKAQKHIRDAPRDQIVCFFNIVQRAFDPPPLFEQYVADFSKGLLKKCVNACRDKCVKIVRKSLGKNVQFTKNCDYFTLNF